MRKDPMQVLGSPTPPGMRNKSRTQSKWDSELWRAGTEQIGYVQVKPRALAEHIQMVSRGKCTRTDTL